MSRRWAAALVGAAAAILALAAWLVWRGAGANRHAALQAEHAGAPAAATPALAPPPSTPATLWLPGPEEKIAPLTTEVASDSEPLARASALVAALLAAQPDPPLAPLFDRPVRLAASVLTPDGVLFVDLRADDGGAPPASGSALELQRVYAIVHTVLRNVPDVSHVVLLWNGVQRLSLSGHVDTGHALSLMPALEAR